MSRAVARTVERVQPVVGTEAQLRAALGVFRAQGHQVVVRNARRQVDGRVRCDLVAIERVPPAPVPRRRWWQRRWPYLTAAALGALGGIGWAVIWLVQLILANPGLAVGALLLAALLVAGLFRACCAVCGR